MLWAHYPRRGSHWAGWAEILPGRSVSSIANRVQKLGVRMEQPERNREGDLRASGRLDDRRVREAAPDARQAAGRS